MISPEEIRKIILKSFPDAQVQARDLTGTGDHYDLKVVSKLFEGKSLLEQHRMVLGCLKDEMDKRLHAVQIKTGV